MSKTSSDINDKMLNRQAKRIEELERERDQLREQVTLLRSYLKRWAFTSSEDEAAHQEVYEALAATEPTSTPTYI